MTTQTEALKLALEALDNLMYWENGKPDYDEAREAIIAIKEALAQQCVCGEPDSAGTHRTDGPCLAPQRTWVGLDWNEMPEIYMNDKAFEHGAQWAEAKLKEKNT